MSNMCTIHIPQEFYGTTEWSSRAMYDAYIGWFSGNPEELFPLTPSERSRRMVDSFGIENVVYYHLLPPFTIYVFFNIMQNVPAVITN